MKQTIDSNKYSWRNLLKLALAVLAVTIICLLFPSHEESQPTYVEGETWKHENLIAERDHQTIIE